MKLTTLVLLFTSVFLGPVLSQDQYYYGANSRPLENGKDARVLKEVIQKSATRYIIKVMERSGNDIKQGEWSIISRDIIRIDKGGNMKVRRKEAQLFPETIFRELNLKEDGLYEFSERGSQGLIRTGFSSRYLPLNLEGTITEYYPNGQLKSISQFDNNQLISNQNWLSNGEKYIDSIFYSVDRAPRFKNAQSFFNQYILRSLNKSEIDISQVQDLIEIGCVIMETGHMEGVISLSGKSSDLRQALVKIIDEMPGGWEPAILNGKAVRYYMSIPLNFQNFSTSFQDLELSSGVLFYNKY